MNQKILIGTLVVAVLAVQNAKALTFSYNAIVNEAMTLPGGDELIAQIHDVAFDGQQVAIHATGSSGTEGIYLVSDGELNVIADTLTHVPGSPDWLQFRDIAVDSGNVVFEGRNTLTAGVYTNLGGSLRSVVDSTMTMPGTSGSFGGFFSGTYSRPRFAIDGEDIVVSASGPRVGGEAAEGVYLDSGGLLTVVADFRTPHPDSAKQFLTFDDVDVEDGEVVFRAGATDFFSSGVYTTLGAASGQIRTVVDQNTELDNLPGPIRIDQNSVVQLDGGNTLFHSIYDPDFEMGFYVSTSSEIRTIVDTFTTNPSNSDEFDEFIFNAALHGSTVAYQTFNRDQFSLGEIYLNRDGRNQQVIAPGDELDGKVLTEVTLFPDSLADETMAFRAEFEDGTMAVYEVEFSRPDRDTFPIFPDFDVQALTANGSIFLSDGDAYLRSQLQPSGFENEAILDFPLASIPSDATIESAYLVVVPLSTIDEPIIGVYGKAGDGVPGNDDVESATTLIGMSQPIVSDAEPVSIPLDVTFIQSLVDSASHLGLKMSVLDGTFLSFVSSESTFDPAPALVITLVYDASLAGDYNNDGTVDAADYTVWRDSLERGTPLENETASLGMVDGEDYAAWKANFGAVKLQGGGSVASVPEPVAVAMWLGLLTPLILLSRRRAISTCHRGGVSGSA